MHEDGRRDPGDGDLTVADDGAPSEREESFRR